MLIQCSTCRKIQKFGQWIKAPEELLAESNIPKRYLLCDDCRGLNGGCERLRHLERKIKPWDVIFPVTAITTTLAIVFLVVSLLQKWAHN